MNRAPIFVHAVGLACPVGLRWASACAAIRAGITRKQSLSYVDNQKRPIVGSALSELSPDGSPDERWLFLLSHALKDVAEQSGGALPSELPMLIALGPEIAGRPLGAERLARELSSRSGLTIGSRWIRVIHDGAHGGYAALSMARELMLGGAYTTCLVAAADSLINARSLLALDKARRLLTETNSDGVIPGEAASCLVLTPRQDAALAAIRGLGFGQEPSLLTNDLPLRAEGVTRAARAALSEAGMAMHEMDFRISDAAGESFYFKEQALLVTRLLRQRKAEFPLSLCAETLGETGAAAGICGLATAIASFTRGYARGSRAIAFAGNDGVHRAALVLEARSTS